MTSNCPKCSGYEFSINNELIENSNAQFITLKCDDCGFVANTAYDEYSDADDLLSAVELLDGTEKSGWEVVSVK